MCLAIPGKIVEMVDMENRIAKVDVGVSHFGQHKLFVAVGGVSVSHFGQKTIIGISSITKREPSSDVPSQTTS